MPARRFFDEMRKEHAATIVNLVNDAAAGLSNISTVTPNGQTIPEVDADYVMPTPIATGHGGFTDGLFAKPPVGSYPAYLDTPQFCGPFSMPGFHAVRHGPRSALELF